MPDAAAPVDVVVGASDRPRGDAVVVVNFGSHRLLVENLVALGADERLGARVVVVDSYTSDEERAAVGSLARAHGWDALLLAGNPGFGDAMNAGVGHARAHGCTGFLLVNPDLRLDPATARALLDHCRERSGDLVSPTVLRPDGTVWFGGGEVLVAEGRTTTRDADSGSDRGWLTGACLAVHADLWDDLGGFDHDYFLYWEDVDLSWRVRRSGGRLVVRGDLTAVHAVGGTQGESKSPVYVRFNCRNRLVFAAKHLERPDRSRWRRTAGGYAWQVLGRGGRRALLRRPVALGTAALRGTLEGLLWRP